MQMSVGSAIDDSVYLAAVAESAACNVTLIHVTLIRRREEEEEEEACDSCHLDSFKMTLYKRRESATASN